MRVGVIGAGSAGSQHVKAFGFLGEVSAYDCVLEKSQQRSQRTLMEWAEAIVIATPPSTHMAILEECIDRGLPVLVEKPLGVSTRGVKALLQTAAMKHIPVLVGYIWRYATSLQSFKFRALRIDGRYLVVGMYSQGLHLRPKPAWLLDPHEGGCLLENSHLLDMLVYLFGRYAVTNATIRESVVLLELAWPGGGYGQAEMDYCYPGTVGKITVVGKKTVTEWDRMQEPDINRLYGVQASHFIDVIEYRNQIKPVVTGWDGLTVLEIAEEAQRCSRSA